MHTTTYKIFGLFLPVELVAGILILSALLLLTIELRQLLFLTLLILLLPALDLGMLSVTARLLRWTFLGALVAKGLLSNLRRGLRPRPITRPHRAVFLLIVLVLGSAFWSIGGELTLAKGFWMVGLWLGVFLVLWNSWESPEDLVHLSDVLFKLVVIVFTLQIWFLVHGAMEGQIAIKRFGGVFKNPNGLGTSVAFLGPFVYWKHRSTANQGVRHICQIMGVVMAVSLVLSGSRSGLLGSIACMGVMITYVHRTKAALAIGLVVVPVLLIFAFGPEWDTEALEESRVVRAESLDTLSDRLPLWEEGFDLASQRPFFGYGYAMNPFAAIGRANEDLARAALRLKGSNYHSSHIQLLLDLGIVGVAVYWYFLVSVIRAGIRLYRHDQRGPLQMAGIAYFAAVLALIGDSLVHGWTFSPGSSMSIVFWLMSAAVLRALYLSDVQQAAEAATTEAPVPVTREAWAAT